MRDILLIIPTRSSGGTRVASLDRLIKSWRKTTSGCSDIMLVLDVDDMDNYQGIIPPMVDVLAMTRTNLVNKLNDAAFAYKDQYKIISFVGDDVVFHTDGWEEYIVTWMEGHTPGMCYCNDLLQEGNLPNNVFLSSGIIDALGYMCPPELQHYYIDNFWKDLGLRMLTSGTGHIQYFPSIVIEHMHWSNKKAEKDELYIESEKMMEQDRQAFDKYREQRMAADIQKIKDYAGQRTTNGKDPKGMPSDGRQTTEGESKS